MNNNENNNQPQDQGGKTIVAVRMNGSDVSQYKLSDGTIVDEQAAVLMVRNDEIQNCIVSNRNDVEYIRSLPDGDPNNNLQNLPRF